MKSFLILSLPTLIGFSTYFYINMPPQKTDGAKLEELADSFADRYGHLDYSEAGREQTMRVITDDLGVELVRELSEEVREECGCLGRTTCRTIWIHWAYSHDSEWHTFWHEVGHVVLDHCDRDNYHGEDSEFVVDYFAEKVRRKIGKWDMTIHDKHRLQ